MPVEYHGNSQAGGGSSTLTSLALPGPIGGVQPGAQIGDVIFLVVTVGSASGSASLSVTDSRFTLLRELDAPNAADGTAWSQGGVWVGYADTLDDITLNADPGTGATDVAKAACIALKARVDTTRVSTVTATTNSYTLPSLPGENDGAVVAIVGRMGLGNASWTPTGYTVAAQGDAYCKVALGYTTTAGTISAEATTWDDLGTGGVIRTNSAVIALRAIPRSIPPLRQTHRSDGLGMMPSPTRIVPVPRSIQGSLRREGPGTHL